MKSLLQNLILLVISTFLVLFSIEMVIMPALISSRQQDQSSKYEIKEEYTNDGMFKKDENLGFTAESNNEVRGTVTLNEQVVNDINYFFDEYGRRVSGEQFGNKNNVLGANSIDNQAVIFGGSYALGAFIEYRDTVASIMEKSLGPNTRVYNYALSAYGPGHMLAQIESDDFTTEVPDSVETDGYYFYMFDHVNRVNLNWISYKTQPLLGEFPYYKVDDDRNVTREGSFYDAKRGEFEYYKLLSNLKTLEYFEINPIPIDYDYELYRTASIIKRAEELFEERYEGDFYVIIYPYIGGPEYKEFHEEMNSKLIEMLKSYDMDVIFLEEDSFITDNREGYITNEGKFHPNGALNKIMVDMILDYKKN